MFVLEVGSVSRCQNEKLFSLKIIMGRREKNFLKSMRVESVFMSLLNRAEMASFASEIFY